uniref:Putative DNA ligase domain protein n=1 Tax=viral metagenome TaxID=1070528 RepID=A0A6M3LTS5_9ZZZZ
MKPIAECMLCESGTEKDLDSSNTVSEVKYDGTRVWAGKKEGEAFVINRNNVDYTDRLTDVTEALEGIPSEDVIFDGEAVVYENGRTVFEYSQRRCSTQSQSKQAVYQLKYPIIVETFDIVHLDGKDLRNYTWQSRRQLLDDLLEESLQRSIRPSRVAYGEDKRRMFDEAIARGEEGVILKALHSPYIGKRSRLWLKVKKWYQELCRVVGYTEGTGKRDNLFGSLILAKPDDSGRLVYCGKVGSGFNDSEVRHIAGLLKAGETEAGLVTVRDASGKPIMYTPVDIPLEVTVKFFESSKAGIFRFPSMMKDDQERNLIHYNSSTIKASPGQQTGLKKLLEGLSRR